MLVIVDTAAVDVRAAIAAERSQSLPMCLSESCHTAEMLTWESGPTWATAFRMPGRCLALTQGLWPAIVLRILLGIWFGNPVRKNPELKPDCCIGENGMKADATSGLGGDFMLAVYLDGQGRVPGYRSGLGFGLSGAMLMELALGGFIYTVDGYIVAVHGALPHDRALGEVLVRIRSSRKLRTTSQWVRALSAGAHKRLSAGLIAEGVLVRTPRRLPLPAGWARRYDVLRSERRDAVVRSLGGAADSSERSVALAALASACRAASGGREWSESEVMLRSMNPACAQILTAVAACVWLAVLSSWT